MKMANLTSSYFFQIFFQISQKLQNCFKIVQNDYIYAVEAKFLISPKFQNCIKMANLTSSYFFEYFFQISQKFQNCLKIVQNDYIYALEAKFPISPKFQNCIKIANLTSSYLLSKMSILKKTPFFLLF